MSSHVEIINRTLLPFELEVVGSAGCHDIGCSKSTKQVESTAAPITSDWIDTRTTKNFSVPAPLLCDFVKEWDSYGQAELTLKITPLLSEFDGNHDSKNALNGIIDVVVSLQELKRSNGGLITSKLVVNCRSKDQLGADVPLALQVVLKMYLAVDEQVYVDVFLEPRAVIENRIPLPMKVRTPMPQTFSTGQKVEGELHEVMYSLDQDGRVEVFTPGPSIAISVGTRDKPIAGTELGWLNGGWVDLPLVAEFSLIEPIAGVLPFETSRMMGVNDTERAEGAEVFIVEGYQALGNLVEIVSSAQPGQGADKTFADTFREGTKDEGPLSFFLTVCNYGVDHTGDLLFEKASLNLGSSVRMTSLRQSDDGLRDSIFGNTPKSSFLEEFTETLVSDSSRKRESKRSIPHPFGAFSSSRLRRRISLLANAQTPIRLLQMTIDADEGLRRTMVSSEPDFS